jgi:hypothetical protein
MPRPTEAVFARFAFLARGRPRGAHQPDLRDDANRDENSVDEQARQALEAEAGNDQCRTHQARQHDDGPIHDPCSEQCPHQGADDEGRPADRTRSKSLRDDERRVTPCVEAAQREAHALEEHGQ